MRSMRRESAAAVALGALVAAFLCVRRGARASEASDFKVARKQVFEFTRRPSASRDGDKVTISFACKDYCDVTVAVERAEASASAARAGRIVRHLASGVLGPKAPPPLQPNSLEQKLVWDGKDERGRYVDDLAGLRVRVSLGLRARFERTLHWHPKKRCGMRKMPRCVAQPEGVYVYEGSGVEYVRLFDHQGKYLRTVCPFPADKLKKVTGLEWGSFPDGHRTPRHQGYWRSSYLLGGGGDTRSKWGSSAKAFAVRAGTIASVRERLCRVATDGSSGPHRIYGPATRMPNYPQSIAISPEKKWLYLSGCYMSINQHQSDTHLARVRWKHAVYRMAFDGDGPAAVWLGDANSSGKDDTHFNQPADVCVDAKGRVYVADHRNDRVQIFSPAGKLLKSLPVRGPAVLQIHHKTQRLYVFSWCMALAYGYTAPPHKTPAVLRVFAPFDDARPRGEISLPLENYQGTTRGYMGSPHFDEAPYRATLDSYTDPPSVWMVTAWPRRGYSKNMGIRRYRIEGGKRLFLLESWNDVVEKAVKRWMPPQLQRQRLFVDPASGTLYVAEDGKKAFDTLTRIDPETGRARIVKLPYSTEDAAIDGIGHIYLRCDRAIGRFNMRTMREVPFDYGEQRSVRWSSASRGGKLLSALVVPGNRPVWWHESGMGVNARGELIVSCCNSNWSEKSRRAGDTKVAASGRKYTPRIYPGRYRYSEIHVWDRHGKIVAEDVVKGVMDGHGTFIDSRGDVYYLAGGHRVYDGKRDFWPLTGCLMKFKRGQGRFYALRKSKRVPIAFSRETVPEGLPQVSCGSLGRFMVQGAQWIYPGVGYVHPTAPCQCWRSRFCVDSFGRVFAPETVRNQIAVLDTNGNLIMHVGSYGNVDDGAPLVADGRFRQSKPRSIGGDEVALAYANYVATHTDHRLFAADGGNGRLLGIRLDYHAGASVPIK